MAKAMSGSGGFYKYRCKYFYAKSCQNWVYVNGEACITCLAEGCDAHEAEDPEPSPSPDMCYPIMRDRILGHGYTVARWPDVDATGAGPSGAPSAEWGRDSRPLHAGAGDSIGDRGGRAGEGSRLRYL